MPGWTSTRLRCANSSSAAKAGRDSWRRSETMAWSSLDTTLRANALPKQIPSPSPVTWRGEWTVSKNRSRTSESTAPGASSRTQGYPRRQHSARYRRGGSEWILAHFAGRFGASIALEPLNPSIMNVESAIWTVEQAAAIVDGVGREISASVWTFGTSGRMPPSNSGSGPTEASVLVVQVSDWRTPRSDQDRLIPGQGELPLSGLLRAVDASGYQGAYSVEIFSGSVSDSLWQRDLARVILESREGMAEAWNIL